MTSMPSLVTRSPATVAARFESDCESLMMISMGCDRPSPHMTPSLTAACHCSTSHWSVSPNAASGPVSGLTKPTLMARPSPASAVPPPSSSLSLPQAASTLPRPPVAPRARPVTPAVLRKSRRVIGVLMPSVALLVCSSELIPPPYVVPPPRRPQWATQAARDPPDGLLVSDCSNGCSYRRLPQPARACQRSVTGVLPPPRLSTIRTFPPTIRASYSRAGWCQGRPDKVRRRLYRRAQAVRTPLTSSGCSLQTLDHLRHGRRLRAASTGRCPRGARRAAGWTSAGTPFSSVSVSSIPVRAFPPMARPMVVIGRLALATAMTCQLVPAGSSRRARRGAGDRRACRRGRP